MQTDVLLSDTKVFNRFPRYSEKMMEWVDDNYQHKCVLERLATVLYLSPSHISHLFHQETGGTLSEYLTSRRLHEATKLLRSTSLPIQEISKQIGYNSASYFTRVFKRHKGITPYHYRQADT
ncbi:helix-turn-helix transcriptional regulator [Paenibacillus qinlingensis]|uniref:helix-turn-helix transcriptional regulator n=1 Tax=Paenibacillus qinlingensis TaxID=1837343 RepID=UPI0015678FE8|nr:AraC family transcriptional regulator [Paenibacillus qinlingensis]NQX60787.1 helix-turn-helix transcriptional regulator [Paenibacillus qinlingensis]